MFAKNLNKNKSFFEVTNQGSVKEIQSQKFRYLNT